jgi:hypothetical protein
MRRFGLLLLAICLCGCAGTKRKGVSVSDAYEGVKIDQMIGNNVSGAVFERTILCLNARRETRHVTLLTNQSVMLVTNVALSYVTNQTITITTNQLQTLATNEVAAPPHAAPAEAATNSAETAAVTLVTSVPTANTNVAVTTASNVTLSKAGNQTVTTASTQSQRSRQITTTTNNLSVTTADNLNVSAETNLVVTVNTNTTVSSVTNFSLVLTNLQIHEYYLVAEYTSPLDFMLQQGDSLVLLVDGARHAFAQTTSPAVLVPRKGFNAVLYRVPPQLLVDIANAREVKIRLKGSAAVIEKEMNQASRDNFRKFLVNFFKPDDSLATPRRLISSR